MIPSPTFPGVRKQTPTKPERYVGGKSDGPVAGRYGGIAPARPCEEFYEDIYDDTYECDE